MGLAIPGPVVPTAFPLVQLSGEAHPSPKTDTPKIYAADDAGIRSIFSISPTQ